MEQIEKYVRGNAEFPEKVLIALIKEFGVCNYKNTDLFKNSNCVFFIDEENALQMVSLNTAFGKQILKYWTEIPLDKEYILWFAKDKDDTMRVFASKPIRNGDKWAASKATPLPIPILSWEDEPFVLKIKDTF